MRVEQSSRQAQRELQMTIDNIPAIAARYRSDGSLDFVNQTWLTYTGLRGQRWEVAIHPVDLPLVEAAWRAQPCCFSWNSACGEPTANIAGTSCAAFHIATRREK